MVSPDRTLMSIFSFVLWHKAFTLSIEGPGPLHPLLRKTSRVRNISWIVAKQIRQACLMPEFRSRGRLILDRGQFFLQLIMEFCIGGLYLVIGWVSGASLFHTAPSFSSSSGMRMSLPDWKVLFGALFHVTEEPALHSSSTGSYCETFVPLSVATSDLFRGDR